MATLFQPNPRNEKRRDVNNIDKYRILDSYVNPTPLAHADASRGMYFQGEGYTDRADSYYLYPSEITLTTRNGQPSHRHGTELALSQRNSTRTPSPQPQLTPCEQLKYNKAQLAKNGNIPQIQTGLRRCTHNDARPLLRRALLRPSTHGAARR
ncbi:hypothetical protein TNCV_31681 [Trichonephila clavipes]|nr:hypothetical protein TNCV_31681 [Trichonephila clavipes]